MRTTRWSRGRSWRRSIPYHTRIRSTSPGLSSSRRRPNWPASEPTSTGSVKKCRFRSRSPDARSPLPEPTRPRQRKSLKLTRDEVEKGIDEARAGLKAAQASLKLAEIEYARFTRLEQQGASTLQRQQQMTQSRDSALAQVDLNQARLAKAVASLTQIDVARRTLESAQKSALKASTGINLAEVGYDQIRELELLVKVKERGVEQAQARIGSRRE